VLLGTGTTLTLTPDGGRYEYSGTIAGDGSLVISGSDGIQILNGDNYYTGGTTVTNGAVLGVSSELALGAASGGGTPDLELDNGTLFVADETHVTANVTFGIGGGSVAGNGVLSFDSPLAFGANSRIEPGASVGHLMLDGPIELASAGTLVIEIGDGEDGTVISDVLFAESAAFTASTLDPFTLFLTNEDGELSTNFDPFSDYAWLILGTIDSMTTFDLDLIEIEVDTNLASTTAGGAFSLFLTDDEVGIFGDGPNTDNLLVLQFTPVPEPSTYALIGLGLGLIGWQASRRRRSV
jgi:autotransporter-associated beta strand protein